ncbi:hypothetical protein MCOR25_009906 [Pyricularia grisea]|nr:hypothetical protein MCOR25_009906 [Pyricularia grisea]
MSSNYYRSSPAAHEQYYFESASPTPSPRHYRESRDFYDMADRRFDMPERPATRSHSRRKSSSSFMQGPPPVRPPTAHPTAAASPRYNSSGQYATVNAPRDAYQSSPMSPEPRRSSHSRRPSVSTPQRPQTTAPGSSSKHKRSSSRQHESYSRPQAPPPPPEQKHRPATQEDAKKHQIPEGYSLSHWDPLETPIILAGSVFDANSLGKWIYDWVAHVHSGPEGREMVGIAGELWLLLIQISGKIKRASEVMPDIRTLENREMVDDFIESGERLNDKLRRLLKRCEGPMLSSSKTGKSKLGTTAGVRFVHTLLGRDYELANTEKFMASVRLWNLRFDANCEDILLNPTK